MTEQEYKDLANSQPKYYYEPRGREWALYEREKDGMGGTKIFEHWDREVVRKRCYELNGWDYKPLNKQPMLQKMCRKYLKRLLPAAKEVGLEEFVVTTIDKNKSGTCVATRQQVDMLASMCEDNRVKREEIPNIVGKSYRFCLTGNLFKRIRKLKDKGLYSKIDTLLLSEELKTK